MPAPDFAVQRIRDLRGERQGCGRGGSAGASGRGHMGRNRAAKPASGADASARYPCGRPNSKTPQA